jgi:tetratricopeptide (TPR) repeat protein
MHELVRRPVSKQLTSDERDNARRRHAAYYAQVLVSADQLYGLGGAAMSRGLRLFDLERANILVGQAWAAEHMNADRAIAQLTSAYAAGEANILALRLPLQEQLTWLGTAAKAAQAVSDWAVECEHLGRLGNIWLRLRQPDRAIESYERCLRIAREIGDRSSEAHTSWNIGLAYQELGDLSAAIAAMQACVDFERETGHPNAGADAAQVDTLRARLTKQTRR